MPKQVPSHPIANDLYPAALVAKVAQFNPCAMFSAHTLSTRFAWVVALIGAALGILRDDNGAKVNDYRAVAQVAANLFADAMLAHRAACPDAVCFTSRGIAPDATRETVAKRWASLITPDAADTTQMLGEVTRQGKGKGLTPLFFAFLTDADPTVRRYKSGDVAITKTWRGVEVPTPDA